jgi:hypothetical protein
MPRAGTGVPPLGGFDGPAYIDAYRSIHRWPDLFGHQTWDPREGTVAVAGIDGQLVFGVNSNAPTYGNADRVAATQVRDILISKYPGLMETRDIGRFPNDAMFHAEATVLLRAAGRNGGTLAGRTIEVHTDRDVCHKCLRVLPKLVLELGNPTVTFVNRWTGFTVTMRDGLRQ